MINDEKSEAPFFDQILSQLIGFNFNTTDISSIIRHWPLVFRIIVNIPLVFRIIVNMLLLYKN